MIWIVQRSSEAPQICLMPGPMLPPLRGAAKKHTILCLVMNCYRLL
jgi:hypothetical protein